MSVKLSPQEWQLISSYLDNQVTAEEKSAVETRLKQDEQYHQAVDGLQRTRALLRSIPARKAPRSFALTPAMVAPKPLSRWLPVFNWGSIAASAAAVILFFATNLLPGLSLAPQAGAPMAAEAPAVEMAAPDAGRVEESNYSRSPIILWGAPLAYGKGGGGGADTSMEKVPGGMGGGPEPMPTLSLEQPAAPEAMPTQIEPLPGNPILGLPDAELAGREIDRAGNPLPAGEAEALRISPANLAAAVLAFLAVCLAIAAFTIRKQLRS